MPFIERLNQMARKRSEKQQIADKYLTKEFLTKALQKYSANYIAKQYFAPKFTTHASDVIDRAKKFGIKTHSISDSQKLKTTQKRKKSLLKQKYGCENVSQIKEIKDKKIKKAIEKYGCINVFQSEEIKNKSKQTLFKKYGVYTPAHISGIKRNNGNFSKLHKEISIFLKTNKIEHQNEIIFYSINGLEKRKHKRADIVIENSKIVIEVNGDLWHANPIRYKNGDIINLWTGPTKAEDIWKKDKEKKELIESHGYKVIYCWEYDIRFNKENLFKELLNEINTNKINK